jgi:hypothetical protein
MIAPAWMVGLELEFQKDDLYQRTTFQTLRQKSVRPMSVRQSFPASVLGRHPIEMCLGVR